MSDIPETVETVGLEARMARLLDLSLGYLLAALVLFMMLLTFVDVVGRQGFNAPVPAGFEVTELLMGFTVYLGLPLVCARREHITIGLLDNLFKGNARRFQGVILNLLCCFMTLVWTRELWIHAGKLAADQEVLMFLKIGKAQFIYAMFGLTLLAAAVFLALAWTRYRAPLETTGDGG